MNVIAASTQSRKAAGGGTARMTFTVEVTHAARLGAVLETVGRVPGVLSVRRR